MNIRIKTINRFIFSIVIIVTVFIFSRLTNATEPYENNIIKLKDGDRYEKAEAYLALKDNRNSKKLLILIDVLNQGNNSIETIEYIIDLIFWYGKDGYQNATSFLINLLEDRELASNPRIRTKLIDCMIHLENDVVPQLVNILLSRDENSLSYGFSIRVLSSIKTGYNVNYLMNTLVKTENGTVESDIRLIIIIIGNYAVSPLEKLLQDKNIKIQDEAKKILKVITSKDYPLPADSNNKL